MALIFLNGFKATNGPKVKNCLFGPEVLIFVCFDRFVQWCEPYELTPAVGC